MSLTCGTRRSYSSSTSVDTRHGALDFRSSPARRSKEHNPGARPPARQPSTEVTELGLAARRSTEHGLGAHPPASRLRRSQSSALPPAGRRSMASAPTRPPAEVRPRHPPGKACSWARRRSSPELRSPNLLSLKNKNRIFCGWSHRRIHELQPSSIRFREVCCFSSKFLTYEPP
jgi:hypothetical protein